MSKVLKGACIIGQSGGPTSVINTSLLGAVKAALASSSITKVLGALNGIEGVLKDELIVFDEEDDNELELLRQTPSSVLGSCRYKLKDYKVDDTDYRRILEIFKKYDVRYFFYNGGNDSMDTCNKISKFMLENNYECRVMGIPKTIDNDLAGTDHCPGYGSAAKYIAQICTELALDARVYPNGPVVILEVMGRNAGWMAASSALAGIHGVGPDLIYLPENPFDLEDFIERVKTIYAKKKTAVVVVSEGIKDKDGVYISEYGSDLAKQKDSFGHAQMGGLAAYLGSAFKRATGLKVRPIELSLLQRCASHSISKADSDEAYMAGYEAVRYAVSGGTDKMAGYKVVREKDYYRCFIEFVPLEQVGGVEVHFPTKWMNEDKTGVTEEFIQYALPLIQGELDYVKEDGMNKFAKLRFKRSR